MRAPSGQREPVPGQRLVDPAEPLEEDAMLRAGQQRGVAGCQQLGLLDLVERGPDAAGLEEGQGERDSGLRLPVCKTAVGQPHRLPGLARASEGWSSARSALAAVRWATAGRLGPDPRLGEERTSPASACRGLCDQLLQARAASSASWPPRPGGHPTGRPIGDPSRGW